MKKILIALLVLAVVGGGGYIYMIENGYTFDSITNTHNTIDIGVSCGNVENALVTSTVTVTVNNYSSRIHSNVEVRLVAYDKRGNIIKEKNTVFFRDLNEHGSLMKVVTLPAKAVSCDCVVSDSSPQ